MSAQKLINELAKHADELRAVESLRYFKTSPGQYGEGDIFIGVSMPALRRVCRSYRLISIDDLQELLASPVHEHRMAAVVIMSDTFHNQDASGQKAYFDLYLKATRLNQINNWDLVDVSARYVVGAYLLDKPRDVLYKLARTNHLWSKRVAILSTPAFYVRGDASDTLALAEILLHDPHDLMHKAVGWMLREVGKYVDEKLLTAFLDAHAHDMPRTMLRYAIERLSPAKRAHYMDAKSRVTRASL